MARTHHAFVNSYNVKFEFAVETLHISRCLPMMMISIFNVIFKIKIPQFFSKLTKLLLKDTKKKIQKDFKVMEIRIYQKSEYNTAFYTSDNLKIFRILSFKLI